jgi:hypothetical protein
VTAVRPDSRKMRRPAVPEGKRAGRAEELRGGPDRIRTGDLILDRDVC